MTNVEARMTEFELRASSFELRHSSFSTMQSFLFETSSEPTINLPGYPAAFSPCLRYRYAWWRVWNRVETPRLVMWVLLHPSTADADDDPTTGRCLDESRARGFDGMCACNLFAHRSPDTDAMKAEWDAVGDDNDYWLVRVAEWCERIVCDWGADGAHQNRDQAVLTLFRSLNREVAVIPSPSGRGLG
jgi:hypothetical protein